MRASSRYGILTAITAAAMIGIAIPATALDVEAVLKDRQATMKQQGKAMGGVKAFLEGKSDQAA
ncbi:MAG: hypothetical protein JO081_19760, partial [Alphaproteobacteria bacterium]|nr:hypothetical protein [Alphaproteobacteria bacterium]